MRLCRRSEAGTITDEDIDIILKRGQEKTEADRDKIKTDMAHNLMNFSLDTVDESSIYMFGEKDYSAVKGGAFASASFINLPQRERKKNYDVNEYYREVLQIAEKKPKPGPKTIRMPTMHDYQFFDRDRVASIVARENELLLLKRTQKARRSVQCLHRVVGCRCSPLSFYPHAGRCCCVAVVLPSCCRCVTAGCVERREAKRNVEARAGHSQPRVRVDVSTEHERTGRQVDG